MTRTLRRLQREAGHDDLILTVFCLLMLGMMVVCFLGGIAIVMSTPPSGAFP
jgi:hypothetical protein